MPDENDVGLQNVVYDENNVERRSWVFCKRTFPRSEVVFVTQTVLVFVLVIVSISCLAVAQTCEETTVWIGILSSSVGYMLPAPKL